MVGVFAFEEVRVLEFLVGQKEEPQAAEAAVVDRLWFGQVTKSHSSSREAVAVQYESGCCVSSGVSVRGHNRSTGASGYCGYWRVGGSGGRELFGWSKWWRRIQLLWRQWILWFSGRRTCQGH